MLGGARCGGVTQAPYSQYAMNTQIPTADAASIESI